MSRDCCLETYSEAYREGKADENKRLVKLLERYKGCQNNEYCTYTCSCLRSDSFIALIKGEKE
jgi:hypothetical protein